MVNIITENRIVFRTKLLSNISLKSIFENVKYHNYYNIVLQQR